MNYEENDITNISLLTEPFAGDLSQGVDLRTHREHQSLYYDLKELRHRLKKQEEDLLFAEEGGNPDLPSWKAVIELATQLLTQNSKDLEIACWLTEALVREYGFKGCLSGFKLLTELLNRFSNTLYPLSEPDEEISSRLLAVAALSGEHHAGTLTSPLYFAPLIEKEEITFSAWAIREAEASDENAFQQLVEQVSLLPAELLEKQSALLTEVRETVEEFYSTLETHYGVAPSLRALLNLIQECEQRLRSVQRAVLASSQTTTSQVTQQASSLNPAPSGAPAVASTRQAAKMALHTALEYYQTQEPHSPITYLLARALRWTEANLAEILEEMIPQDEIKADLGRVLGLPFNFGPVEDSED